MYMRELIRSQSRTGNRTGLVGRAGLWASSSVEKSCWCCCLRTLYGLVIDIRPRIKESDRRRKLNLASLRAHPKISIAKRHTRPRGPLIQIEYREKSYLSAFNFAYNADCSALPARVLGIRRAMSWCSIGVQPKTQFLRANSWAS